TSAVFAAIVGGKVDAGVLSTPTEGQAQEQGFHEILFLGDLLDLPSNGLSTTVSYISRNRPIVVGMLRGMLKANVWIRAHPEETQKLIADKLGTSPSVAKKTYDRMAPLLTKTGETKPEGLQRYLDLLQESTGKKATLDAQQLA